MQFLVLGKAAGTRGTHIASVSVRYSLSNATLSIVLLAAAVGTVAALLVAGRIIARMARAEPWPRAG